MDRREFLDLSYTEFVADRHEHWVGEMSEQFLSYVPAYMEDWTDFLAVMREERQLYRREDRLVDLVAAAVENGDKGFEMTEHKDGGFNLPEPFETLIYGEEDGTQYWLWLLWKCLKEGNIHDIRHWWLKEAKKAVDLLEREIERRSLRKKYGKR